MLQSNNAVRVSSVEYKAEGFLLEISWCRYKKWN